MYDLIVIGGGPAGIFASIFAKEKGKKVLLLEKMEKIGKKLLIAGSGQCNLTHSGDYKEFLKRYGDNGKFLKRALYKYSPEHMKEFFKEKGLELVVNEKGKYFPNTYKSIDVLNLLKKELLGVEVRINSEVLGVEKVEDKFLCKTKDDKFYGKNLLIATGGLSIPQTGSSGDGYKFGRNFGHKVEELAPSLTPCYVNDYIYSDLSGISFREVEINIYRQDKLVKNLQGDLLFTHKNLSGPVIIDGSRYMQKGDSLEVKFVKVKKEKFEEEFRKNIRINSNKQLKNLIFDENLSNRFVEKELKILGIDKDKKGSDLKKEEILSIIRSFCQKRFVISSLEGYNVAMATRGGISLDEINKNTFESKLVDNLYFAGEVLDLDGDTGGFNIQCAYATGALVAESI